MNFQFTPFIIDFGCLRDEFQPEGNANPFPGEKRKKVSFASQSTKNILSEGNKK